MKKQVRGGIDTELAAYCAERLSHLQRVLASRAEPMRDAAVLAIRLGHSAYHCVHVMLARRAVSNPDVLEVAGLVRLLTASGH